MVRHSLCAWVEPNRAADELAKLYWRCFSLLGVISVCFDRGPLGELQAVAERSTAAPVALAPGPGVGDSPLPVVKRSFETIQQSKDDPPYTSSVTGEAPIANVCKCCMCFILSGGCCVYSWRCLCEPVEL